MSMDREAWGRTGEKGEVSLRWLWRSIPYMYIDIQSVMVLKHSSYNFILGPFIYSHQASCAGNMGCCHFLEFLKGLPAVWNVAKKGIWVMCENIMFLKLVGGYRAHCLCVWGNCTAMQTGCTRCQSRQRITPVYSHTHTETSPGRDVSAWQWLMHSRWTLILLCCTVICAACIPYAHTHTTLCGAPPVSLCI